MDSFYKYLFSVYGNKLSWKIGKKIIFNSNAILEKRGVLGANNINHLLYQKIKNGKPFFAGRIGGVECSALSDYIMTKKIIGRPHIRKKILYNLYYNAGFFPMDEKQAQRFVEIMFEACKEVDCLARWIGNFENYIIEEYSKKAVLTNLLYLEPWQEKVKIPWTAALKGKKVLIVHPFEKSIKAQYIHREKIFKDQRILPQFELKTLKAVQTVAGETDDRFDTWFEALEWMFQEAIKIDFDVAIIGCGAYGFPLAAKLKKVGKQAIHLGGVTQILFGIMGKRWDVSIDDTYGYIKKLENEYWIRPSERETPLNSNVIENGCYW